MKSHFRIGDQNKKLTKTKNKKDRENPFQNTSFQNDISIIYILCTIIIYTNAKS